ncbi:MAG TPA: hypothetical protein VL171_11075 [Verrucomicrobiae bacterium]|nr:hypothetical protein [Verrucomicrobiae bacterium]
MVNLRLGILICALPIGFSQPASTIAEETATNSDAINLIIDGVQYENVRWGRVTPATVTIFHKTGVAAIPLWKLPPDLQKKFGYDPQKAAEWLKIETKAVQERARAQQEARSRETPDETPAPPGSIPSYALHSNLPPGVHFTVLSETGSSEPFAPFERLQFQLAFDDPGSYQKMLRDFDRVFISHRSTIDGRLFPRSVIENLRAYGDPPGYKTQSFHWRQVLNLLPPQTGKYNIQVVMDTPTAN